ncbi:MAG: XdhC family protein [Akkermansiaceae bacterium]|nr:XdhC family protein [Armatimonadota bacterium]
MKELQEILDAAKSLRERGEAAVLATVVEVRGSTYRRTGARLLLSQQGWVAGGISGGCLEGDVLRKAWWRTEPSGCALVTYDSTADEDDEMAWGLGLGCNGVVRVLLERLPPEGETEPFAFLHCCLASRQVGAFATVYESPAHPEWVGQRFWHSAIETGGTVADAALHDAILQDSTTVLRERLSRNMTYPSQDGSGVSVFWERIVPSTPLVIYGAGQDTLPVIRFAKELGWHVTAVAPRTLTNPTLMARRLAGADAVVTGLTDDQSRDVNLDDNTAVLLMTHQYFDDLAILPAVLRSPARYVGVLGPRKRADRLLAELARRGESFTSEQLGRLHAPVGLDIGADSPEEIALSVIAEIKAAMTGRGGTSLRERADAIHPRGNAEPDAPLQTTEKVTCLLTAT